MSEQTAIPKHIALIMDGNRRWARQHKMEVIQGHDYVANKVIEPLVDHCIKRGVAYLTLWAFSTENWQRDPYEVEGLMNIFRGGFHQSAKRLSEKGVRLNVIGDMTRFPKDIQKNAAEWLEMSKENKKITVTFALNYGGRDEILRAVRKMLVENKEQIADEKADLHKLVTAEKLSNYLDTNGLPDPDLLIRPGGEQRLSGFLTWQAIYAEFYFTDVLMPEFGPAELDKALDEYAQRARRFGK